METLILVNRRDRQIGTMEKLAAHRKGFLHRCFSIFVVNDQGQTLLQRRALDKYHSGGLWSNACCGHPRPGEKTTLAAERRLEEEFGLKSDLREIHHFIYRTKFSNGLTEHEYDHVLAGSFNGTPKPDPKEILEWKWAEITKLKSAIAKTPKLYTYWLKACLEEVSPRLARLSGEKTGASLL